MIQLSCLARIMVHLENTVNSWLNLLLASFSSVLAAGCASSSSAVRFVVVVTARSSGRAVAVARQDSSGRCHRLPSPSSHQDFEVITALHGPRDWASLVTLSLSSLETPILMRLLEVAKIFDWTLFLGCHAISFPRRKKSVGGPSTITGVHVWSLNSKIIHRWSSNYQNHSHLALRAVLTRDVNGTDIFQPYSNSIQSGMVFICPYPIPGIQYS